MDARGPGRRAGPVRRVGPVVLLASVCLLAACATRAGQTTPGAAAGAPARPGALPPSPRVLAIGQTCTWQHGISVTVTGVGARRTGRPGYAVDLRVANRTPFGYATAGLRVSVWVGAGQREASHDAELGAGLSAVLPPDQVTSGDYGFAAPPAAAAGEVLVGVRPSPVDQVCLFRGVAVPG
jgi:hypothetical protein